MILVGNKADLEQHRQVSQTEHAVSLIGSDGISQSGRVTFARLKVEVSAASAEIQQDVSEKTIKNNGRRNADVRGERKDRGRKGSVVK